MGKEYNTTINANFNRKVQEQNFGGRKYTSFNPGISFSVEVDEDLSAEELKERAGELYMIARHVVESAIQQRKQEIQGERDEQDFLADAKRAAKKMGERQGDKEWDYPEHVDPPLSK